MPPALLEVYDSTRSLPEPSSLILLGGGLIGCFIFARYYSTRKILILSAILLLYNHVVYAGLTETNVDDKVSLKFASPLFNTKTNILGVDMIITNTSEESIFTPLKVVITGLSSSDVTVANPDSYTSDGLPFYDLTGSVGGNELSSGEQTPGRRIYFYNPKRVKFRWDQDVLAFIDVIEDDAPFIEAICIVPGELQPVCMVYYEGFEAENAEFERIQNNSLPEMYMYEQVQVYAFDYEDMPLSVTINGDEASYHEDGYYYTYMVLKEGLNTISINVTNDAGISVTRDISLMIDSIPPRIDVLEPADGALVTIPDQIIRGTVDDTEVNKVILIKDYINLGEVPVSDGVFNAGVSLSPGHNYITIKGNDAAGNISQQNLDLIYVYSESGEIAGHINNSILGLPISGATVKITDTETSSTAISDKDGFYRLSGVRSGDITIYVEKDGYISRKIQAFLPGGEIPCTQDVALLPVNTPDTFTLTGQVKDTGGLPIQDVKISVKDTSLAAIPDINGVYIIAGIPRTSFVVVASSELHEKVSLNVNAGLYDSKTTVLIHNFTLKDLISYIRIISPAEGEYIEGNEIVVSGIIKDDSRDVGVWVNDIPAWIYEGRFIANDIPLSEGINIITAEMIDPSGTLLTDSVEVVLLKEADSNVKIHTEEASLVPAELSIDIENPFDISLEVYSIEINGPGPVEVISDNVLRHRAFINVPGIYTITFRATDAMGNRYEDTVGYTGMSREYVEGVLKGLWMRLKDDLASKKIEDALMRFSPETRWRYQEQFSLAGDRISEIFSDISDIKLITLKDNVAKGRVKKDEITYYVWFVRDIYGFWKIHKF